MAYSLEKDVYPFIGTDEDTDIIIFFTDGNSEPKKVNVRRCIEGEDNLLEGNGHGYADGSGDLKDFLLACPRSPRRPIQFSWNKAPGLESNFQELDGIQYAYQNIYKDGFISSISTISEVAYPPAIQGLGTSSLATTTIENECILAIPRETAEVEKVRILFRVGNEGVFKIIDEVSNIQDNQNVDFDYDPDDDFLGYYTFRNDSIYPILPASQSQKNFDNLPRKAKTQSLSGNRLMYGNYLEGFDEVATNAQVSVVFENVDQTGALAGSSTQITPINVFTDKSRSGGARGYSAGFSINFGDQQIPNGNYRLSIDFAPEMNYHLFNGHSYRPARNVYFNGSNGFSVDGTSASAADSATGLFSIEAGTSGFINNTSDNQTLIYGFRKEASGAATGIGRIPWRHAGGNIDFLPIGSTPANPLIMPSAVISFDIIFTVNGPSGGIGPNTLASAIESVIANGNPQSAYVIVDEFTTASSQNGGTGGEGVFTDTELIGVGAGVNMIVECNSAVESKGTFAANSPLADRICYVPYTDALEVTAGFESIEGARYGAPAGFFIVKSGKMLVNVTPVGNTSGTQLENSSTSPLFASGNSPQTSTVKHFRFEVESVADLDLLTALPEPVDGAGTGYFDATGLTTEPLTPWNLPFTALPENGGENVLIGASTWPFVTYGSNAQWSADDVVFTEVQGIGGAGLNTFIGGNDDLDNGTVYAAKAGTATFGDEFFFSPGLNVTFVATNKEDFTNPTGGISAPSNEYPYRFTADIVTSDPISAGDLIDNTSYVSGSVKGERRYTIDTTSIEWAGGIYPGSPGYENIWRQDPFDDDNDGVTINDGTIVWAMIATSEYNLLSEELTNQNTPKRSAITNKDGDILRVNTGLINGIAREAPIAIARWHVFDKEDIINDGWRENFTYNITTENGGLSIITLVDPSAWVSPYSQSWLGYSDFDTNPRLDNFLDSDQDVGGRFLCFIDGAAGVGGLLSEGVDGYSSVSNGETFKSYAIGDNPTNLINGEFLNTGADVPVSNRRGSVWNTTLVGIHENFRYLGVENTASAYKDPSSPSDLDKKAAPLSDLGSFLDVGIEGDSSSSFKTRDFHDFGIVYFDAKGRAGTVNSLPSAYVPGYSPEEREEGQKGAVAIRYTINHAPPPWAASYKIVYGGSINTRRFIQYVAGGAYVEPGILGGQDDKIYVSLNYLQGNKISYSNAYGAKDQDTGEPTLYRYTPGDKLRIISHYTNNDNIQYAPKSYEFDVLGVEEISIEQENPLLFDDGDASDLDRTRRSGSFVVLRNNLEADGFTATDVSGGSDNWGDRCIFEIVTPRKTRGEEIVPYYETPFGGLIGGSPLQHQYGTITIDQGDVFFRQVPVNIRAYEDASGEFTDLITVNENTGDVTSAARFRPFFLETAAVTDLYRSVSTSKGKVYFKQRDARERRNDTSIIYSDPTNQESFNVFYTSFSPLVQNYFDLPAKYGDIDYMADAGDSLFVGQNSKIGILQVDKSLTTSASGVDTLNISSDVLSSPRFFTDDIGTDGNPEAVTWDNSTFYFVDKSKGVVASASNAGFKIMSSAGMKRFFKDFLDGYRSNSRITTGVNPFTNEFIVSAMLQGGENSFNVSEGVIKPSWDNIKTFSYDLSSDTWATGYSFYSSCYANVADDFISFKPYIIDTREPKLEYDNVYIHKKGPKNTFYDREYKSLFESVASKMPNSTKDYKAISIDGSVPWSVYLNTTKEDAYISNTMFSPYEGTFYSQIPRTSTVSSSTNMKAVGTIESITPVTEGIFGGEEAAGRVYDVAFSRDITQYHITLGKPAFRGGTDLSERVCRGLFLAISTISSVPPSPFLAIDDRPYECVPIAIVDKNTLRIQFEDELDQPSQGVLLNQYPNRTFIVESFSPVFGDSMRDKYLTLCAVSTLGKPEDKNELYSINIDYIESKLDSSR